MPETQVEQLEDALTLGEAALFLRVPDAELLRLIESHDIPAQQIGGEWRLSKKALSEWLRFGRDYLRMRREWPWIFDHPMIEEFLFLLEKRLLDKLNGKKPPSARGSKQAVLQHFGVFEDEHDLEEELASIHARRKAARE